MWILAASLCANVYLVAEKYWLSLSTPNENDDVIIGEMTQMMLETDEYQRLAGKETVYSITAGVDRSKGGSEPYNYVVVVKTDKQAYLFSCSDGTCSDVDMIGTIYSDYAEDKTKLPLKE
ncbi:hypothetical protein QMA09_15085 [Planococcus sp. APC 3906]|uniref:hypothetical protein n=1 Tax=Planococcus sp. APC 3906 TaxID=3035194 RepID=UPI0025B3E475|nr:hypothetical protein [Planococcus sp. APC 3906]MDN3451522.1 hypothetical protein [Planococcus sp. APC 3906]